MKTLFILRHAKSSWADKDLTDFDRPLNDRGKAAAPFMGRLLREKGLAPDVIFSSQAVRAKKTAKLFKDAGQFDADIIFDERIYEASTTTLLNVASDATDDHHSVMLVGHNPGMEGLVRILTGHAEPMPTAAIAVIDLDIQRWTDIASGVGKLRAIFRPRDEMA
ncbi:MAG TPA: histidine phosphatase family protein [Pyrinomonadaceae bacterium]|jgi:phosphohistidine phosphatase|nr:histidine phosphatase family protein [Pyrinomonadaceae bacterium]